GSVTISTFAGPGEARHSGDGGPTSRAGVFGARAVKVAPDGTVYILERQGSTLRAVDPGTGVIDTVAGTGARGYSGDDGRAHEAVFDAPKEFTLDPGGDILIVDTENHAIRRIYAASGIVETIAGGRKGPEGNGGPPTAAGLGRPHGAVGEAASLFPVALAAHRLKSPTVIFPHPVAVLLAAQIVHKAAPQDQGIAPRVEAEGAIDDRLQGFGFGAAIDEIADAARSRPPH